ncbi:MAG: hypothetical protein HYR70_08020 [Chloroflexi bacterium]|nr:hypothetical protein [Chloroflexota bacterium]MBI1855710.1 hypothetical protein [Chloroflexota bacterium]MBI3339224.1 hypothetical protein [Chloroflexota bacterium]
MEQNTDITQRSRRIPRIVWFLAIGLVIALIAIFVFNVAVNIVAYYGFIVVMVGSHFFMHGSHGGHGNHAEQQPGAASNLAEADKDKNKNEHAGHSGGCH